MPIIWIVAIVTPCLAVRPGESGSDSIPIESSGSAQGCPPPPSLLPPSHPHTYQHLLTATVPPAAFGLSKGQMALAPETCFLAVATPTARPEQPVVFEHVTL